MGASNEPRSIWARGLRSHPGVLGSAVGHEEPLQTVAVLEEMLASGERSLSLNTRVKEVLYGWMNNCFYEAKSFIEANGKFVIDFNGIGTRPVTRK